MNLMGPFKAQGYFRLLPQERPETLEGVLRLAHISVHQLTRGMTIENQRA
jgi:hypothetical protein